MIDNNQRSRIKRAGIMVTRRELLVTKFLSSNGHLKIPEWASSKVSHLRISEMIDVASRQMDSIERIIGNLLFDQFLFYK
jgi:hypothetical protein